MVNVADVYNSQRGHVVAPAGCGKTELIAECIAESIEKPALVLTHTTAGVAALRHRLIRAGVSSQNYSLNTIAGWALNLASMFPERSGYLQDQLDTPNYPAVQAAIGALCHSGNIHSELKATYSRLLTDEYQDCSVSQHSIICGIANAIPTAVFGDPMQAIFGFGVDDPLPDWDTQVIPAFPEIGQLVTPWRWNNANANDLGLWLLAARTSLSNDQQIDLRTCPDRVYWHQLTGNDQTDIQAQITEQYRISNENPGDTLLIIGDSRRVASRHSYASRAQGVSVVEPVDFRDVLAFAARMNDQTGDALLQSCFDFLTTVMTNVQGGLLLNRVQSIINNRNRTPPTRQELAAISLYHNGGFNEAAAFLTSMAADSDRRKYRHSAFKIMLDALTAAANSVEPSLNATIAKLREQRRHAGRSIPFKAVGSTLLLKGLEADHVLILDADRPGSPMTKQHLYVALTRGAKSVHIFSRNCVLPQ